MEEKTRKLLARVQAVREAAARRGLAEANAARTEASRKTLELAREQQDVSDRFLEGETDPALSEHADRYLRVLSARGKEAGRKLDAADEEREAARQRFLLARAKARQFRL